MKPDYDTTVARIAGNIAAGLVTSGEVHASPASREDRRAEIVALAVDLARRIVARVRETEPATKAAPAYPEADDPRDELFPRPRRES